MFLFYFIFFLGRLLVLYFSLVAPAICNLLFLHVVLYVFSANKMMMIVQSTMIPQLFLRIQ